MYLYKNSRYMYLSSILFFFSVKDVLIDDQVLIHITLSIICRYIFFVNLLRAFFKKFISVLKFVFLDLWEYKPDNFHIKFYIIKMFFYAGLPWYLIPWKTKKESIKEIKNNLLSEPVSLIYYLYQTVRISNLFQKDISLCVIMEKSRSALSFWLFSLQRFSFQIWWKWDKIDVYFGLFSLTHQDYRKYIVKYEYTVITFTR